MHYKTLFWEQDYAAYMCVDKYEASPVLFLVKHLKWMLSLPPTQTT